MEYVDVYTAQRTPVGRIEERGKPLGDGEYRIIVHAAIFNSRGELLIQQRQPFKSGWPNLWEVTVGGSAIAGDTSRSAAERETLEEIGLHIDLSSEQPKLTIPFDCGFDDVYTLTMDVDLSALTLQESEVQAVKWASEDEILAMLADGRFIPYHRAFIQLIFALKDSRGAHVSKLG